MTALSCPTEGVPLVSIASQPFWLFWTTAEGKPRSHAPDCFARLAGYRHPRHYLPEAAAAARAAFAAPAGLLEGAEQVSDPIAVLPVLFHLLWRRDLQTGLERPALAAPSKNEFTRSGFAGQDGGMLVDHFPLVGLRLSTPRLELRLPAPEELAALAELAAEGIHDPAVMPFAAEWTDQPPADLARGVVQHHWAQLGAWSSDKWELNLAVFRDGLVVGQQSIGARDFAITREVHTGSWLGKRFQGQGIGTEMRAAVLHLAFEGLGAAEASSSAFVDNAASLAVSRKLGYEEVGTSRQVVRGALAVEHRLRITDEAWRSRHATEVTVHGLAPCLPLLGAAS